MKKYPALKIEQFGEGKGVTPTTIYVTSIPLKDISDATYDRWSRENREGYQRPPKESRFKTGKGSITRYLLKELGTFPTSILINIRGTLSFTPTMKVSEKIEMGEVSFDEKTAYIIDGQHRVEALKRVAQTNSKFLDYPLPISLTNFKEKFDEMVHFYIVNSRQKGIETKLAYKHLQTFMSKAVIGGKEWIKDVILGPSEERKALSVCIVDALNELDNSPFKNKIIYIGETETIGRLVPDYYLERFITKILRDKSLSNMDPDKLASLLADYWSAIKELYPKCFEKHDEYTLLKTTGIATYTYLFPTIYSYCAMDANVTKENFKRYLKMLKETVIDPELHMDFQRPIDEEWWSTGHGPSVSRATSEGQFDYIVKSFAKKIGLVMKSKK